MSKETMELLYTLLDDELNFWFFPSMEIAQQHANAINELGKELGKPANFQAKVSSQLIDGEKRYCVVQP